MKSKRECVVVMAYLCDHETRDTYIVTYTALDLT